MTPSKKEKSQKNLSVDVLDWNKKKIGVFSLDPFVFSQPLKWNIVSGLVRQERAKRRQGSHSTKTRAAVRGGGKKPFRQKGTGRARQGSIRSPLLRKGGVSHGPQPRDYSIKISSKERKLGVRSTLSHIYSEGKLFVVDQMESEKGKTKELALRLKSFGSKALLVDDNQDQLFRRACKNLKSFMCLEARGINVYDLLRYEQLICTKKAIQKIHSMYGTMQGAMKKAANGELK